MNGRTEPSPEEGQRIIHALFELVCTWSLKRIEDTLRAAAMKST